MQAILSCYHMHELARGEENLPGCGSDGVFALDQRRGRRWQLNSGKLFWAQGKAGRGGSRLGSDRGSSHKVWEALNFQEYKCGGLSNSLKCWVPVGFVLGSSNGRGHGRAWQRSWRVGRPRGGVKRVNGCQEVDGKVLVWQSAGGWLSEGVVSGRHTGGGDDVVAG